MKRVSLVICLAGVSKLSFATHCFGSYIKPDGFCTPVFLSLSTLKNDTEQNIQWSSTQSISFYPSTYSGGPCTPGDTSNIYDLNVPHDRVILKASDILSNTNLPEGVSIRSIQTETCNSQGQWR
jgi:hypothetical protein